MRLGLIEIAFTPNRVTKRIGGIVHVAERRTKMITRRECMRQRWKPGGDETRESAARCEARQRGPRNAGDAQINVSDQPQQSRPRSAPSAPADDAPALPRSPPSSASAHSCAAADRLAFGRMSPPPAQIRHRRSSQSLAASHSINPGTVVRTFRAALGHDRAMRAFGDAEQNEGEERRRIFADAE